jgi:hypothetical protein
LQVLFLSYLGGISGGICSTVAEGADGQKENKGW